jgi:hypothetical protein
VSRSDRMSALNPYLCRLSEGSGRYRSRFRNTAGFNCKGNPATMR